MSTLRGCDAPASLTLRYRCRPSKILRGKASFKSDRCFVAVHWYYAEITRVRSLSLLRP
ncbi:MAG: hypothetical protein ACYTX0_39570 [Nostoc sp.]